MESIVYGPAGDPATIAEREWFWKEIERWKKISHDLYMAAAHVNNCKPCRNRSIPAMHNYEEATND